jgi:hypothetical protein
VKSTSDSLHAGTSEVEYCPECGQPLTFARAEPVRRPAISWRSIFLVAVGLYLAITFGVGAWHAEQANRSVTACPGTGVEMGCGSAPRYLAQQLSSQFLPGGAALAPRIIDRDFGSDLRFVIAGLAGIAIGVGAVLARLNRPGGLAFGTDLFLAFEGLVTVFYGQVLLLGVYLLVSDSPSGTPLTLGSLGESLFRALSMLFALVGVQ